MPISIPWMNLVKLLMRFLLRKGTGWDSIMIVGPSLIIAGFVYFACVEHIDPSRNILSTAYRSVIPGQTYEFRGGSATGFYYQVGQALADKSKDTSTPFTLEKTDGGSRAILGKVSSNSGPTFGLAQDDYVAEFNQQSVQVKEICPLYEEKLHIVYDLAKWKERSDENDDPRPKLSSPLDEEGDQPPTLSLSPDERTRAFFKGARIRFKSDAPGVGRLNAGELLVGLAGLTHEKTVACSVGEVIATLEGCPGKCEFDVAFVTLGAPHTKMKEILENDHGRFGLMSVEPELAQSLVRVARKPYSFTNFEGVYDGYGNVWTVGIDAILIASRDVGQSAIAHVLLLLKDIGDKETEETTGVSALLSKSDDFESRAAQFQVGVFQKIKAWTFSSLGLLVLIIASTGIVTWIVSTGKETLYVQKITKIYREGLPKTGELDGTERPIPLPLIEGEPTWCVRCVRKIISGLAKLIDLTMEIRDDYDSGGIVIWHQRYLLETIHGIRAVFRRHLAARLRQAIESGVDVNVRSLHRLRVANYLDADSFRELSQLLESRASRAGGAVVPGRKGQLLTLLNWGDGGP